MKKFLKLGAVLTALIFVLACFTACSNNGDSGSGNENTNESNNSNNNANGNNNSGNKEDEEEYTFSRTTTLELSGSDEGYYISYDNHTYDKDGKKVSSNSTGQEGYWCPHPTTYLWSSFVEKEDYYFVDSFNETLKIYPKAKVEIEDAKITITILESVDEEVEFSSFKIKDQDGRIIGRVSGTWDPKKGFYHTETTGSFPSETKTVYGSLKWTEGW